MKTDRYDWSDLPAMNTSDIEEAVADNEPMILVGPPGAGRTMLARRIPTIMPRLTDHAITWLRTEYAEAGISVRDDIEPPFRAPHHTISQAAMLGTPERWGQKYNPTTNIPIKGERQYHPPRAGEFHLARYGVLMLDELAEFPKALIGALGERLKRLGDIDAKPLIVAATNPCPCGWWGSNLRDCTCSETSKLAYDERVQGFAKLLGIGRWINVQLIALDELRDAPRADSSATVRERISRFRSGLNL